MKTSEPDSSRFFVVTGGPGSGKTSLVNALGLMGYLPTEEAGRAIIQDQVAIGGKALPWDDRLLFAESMLSWEMRSYRMAQGSAGPVFFDRGVPDVIGYLRLIGWVMPHHLNSAALKFRYNRCVFIAPPWEEIFHPDAERKQDFNEAASTYEVLAETYTSCGYDLVELPRASIEERVKFVLQKIGLSNPMKP